MTSCVCLFACVCLSVSFLSILKQYLMLLFSMKFKKMVKMRLLAILIDLRQSFKIAKKIVISQIPNEILKQKSFTRSGLKGTPKPFLNKLVSRDYFHVKTMRHSRFQHGQFFVHCFEIWQFHS